MHILSRYASHNTVYHDSDTNQFCDLTQTQSQKFDIASELGLRLLLMCKQRLVMPTYLCAYIHTCVYATCLMARGRDLCAVSKWHYAHIQGQCALPVIDVDFRIFNPRNEKVCQGKQSNFRISGIPTISFQSKLYSQIQHSRKPWLIQVSPGHWHQ